MTTGPLSIISPFSLRLRSLWSYCILVTGLDRPLPCPLISPGSPRRNSAWSKQTANAQTFYSWPWRRIGAQWMPDIHTPKEIPTHKWKIAFRTPATMRNTIYHRAGKSPAMCAHTTHHTTQAARPRPARTIDEITGDDHRRANGHATFSQIAPG